MSSYGGRSPAGGLTCSVDRETIRDGWKRQPGMLGLRFIFLQPHQKTWPTGGTMDWLWPAAERAGVPIAPLAADFLPVVGQIAERHPGLKLIIDHYGRAQRTKDDAAWANLAEILALARRSSLSVKATGAPSEPYPYRNIHPHLRRLYRCVRPRALVLGNRHHAHASA